MTEKHTPGPWSYHQAQTSPLSKIHAYEISTPAFDVASQRERTMQITIDQEAINEAIQATATQGIKDSLGSYSVTNAISKIVTDQIADGAIGKAVAEAVSKVDNEALTQAIADELSRATVRASAAILQDGMTDVICKLRGIRDFDTDYQKKREAIKAQLFGRK